VVPSGAANTYQDFTVNFAGTTCTPTSFSGTTLVCTIAKNADNTLKLEAGTNLIPQIHVA